MVYEARHTKGPFYNLWTMQVLISLCTCAGWSGPSFSVFRISGYCNICWWTENAKIRQQRCALIWTFPVCMWHKGLFPILCIICNFPWNYGVHNFPCSCRMDIENSESSHRKQTTCPECVDAWANFDVSTFSFLDLLEPAQYWMWDLMFLYPPDVL